MAILKVFGHKAPDTDTVCCAVIWAWYLNEVRKTPATPYMLGEPNKETSFVLNYWKVKQPALLESVAEGDEVVIVDTNNPQELFENLSDATIVEIVDHHKLSGLMTSAPLSITMRPLASTASVMYDMMGEATKSLPKEIAGLMLSCILSDTLEFRSPTTTPHDKEIAQALAKQLGVDIPKYAAEMFAAKSDVSDYSDVGLIHIDSKKFEVGPKNIRISVVETTTPDSILKRKAGIIAAFKDVIAEDKADDVLFFVVDILKEEATVLTYNDFTKSVVEKSFGVKVTGDTAVLPGIVSRKKQIVPVLKI